MHLGKLAAQIFSLPSNRWKSSKIGTTCQTLRFHFNRPNFRQQPLRWRACKTSFFSIFAVLVWTVWYIEHYSMSVDAGVTNCRNTVWFFGPPCTLKVLLYAVTGDVHWNYSILSFAVVYYYPHLVCCVCILGHCHQNCSNIVCLPTWSLMK